MLRVKKLTGGHRRQGPWRPFDVSESERKFILARVTQVFAKIDGLKEGKGTNEFSLFLCKFCLFGEDGLI